MTDYPLPSYAATIWLAGDQIHLALPPSAEEGRSHLLRLPNSFAGLQCLVYLLKQREDYGRADTVGKRSAPVQYDLDHILKQIKSYSGPIEKFTPRGPKRTATEELTLEDLGL